MTETKTYNGWTNYETWVIKLWMDNDEPAYRHWREVTRECWEAAEDKSPNQFMNKSANARHALACRLENEHDSHSKHRVFDAAINSVYADLLNAALREVNWYEIANSLLQDEELEGYKERDS